jgi:protein-disulfide isomerase/type II secretory pathway component PulC
MLALIVAAVLLIARVAAVESAQVQPAFTVEQLRAASPVEAYLLERAYYDHLLAVARGLAAGKGTPNIVGLDPPARPRLNLDLAQAPRLGQADAPVTIAVVEDLAQIHAQRLDAQLQALVRRFGRAVALAHVSWTDPRRPSSLPAAVAARCADRQDRFWPYRGLVLADVERQDRGALVGHAGKLGLDVAAFRVCLDDAEVRALVERDTALARAAGIMRTPTLLIAGVYAGGAEPAETVAALVESALDAAGAGTGTLPESALPFDVTGILRLPGRQPEAIVVERGADAGRVVTIGDRLDPSTVVNAIVPDAVIVTRGEARERLPLRFRAGATPGRSPQPSDRALVRENVSTLTIDDALVARLLAARPEMDAQFTPGSLEVEGKRLLKLTGKEHADLFARLGLEAGDVLMRVNDEWVYQGRNTLVDEIAAGPSVTLVIVRRGIPRLVELNAER